MWNMAQRCATLTPELTRRSQLDLYESKACLVYTVSSRLFKDYIVRLCLKKYKPKTNKQQKEDSTGETTLQVVLRPLYNHAPMSTIT